MALDEALPIGPQPKREIIHWSPFDIRGWQGFEKEYEARGIADKVRVDLVPNNGALDVHDLEIKTAGEYIVRVKLSGLRPEGGRAPRLRLYAGDISRVLYEQDVEAPEDQAGDDRISRASAGGQSSDPNRQRRAGAESRGPPLAPGGAPNTFTDLQSRVPWQMKFTDDDGKPIVPFLLLDSIEWEGPIVESWPTPAHQQIFFGGESATKDAAYARLDPRAIRRAGVSSSGSCRRGGSPDEAVRQVAEARRQFRVVREDGAARRALLEELPLSRRRQAQTSRHAADRLGTGFAALVFPLEHDAGSAAARSGPRRKIARNRKRFAAKCGGCWPIRKAGGNSPRRFPYQWLQLRRVGMFPPDKVLYPDYDEDLEQSMIAETVGFFGEVLTRNDSSANFSIPTGRC